MYLYDDMTRPLFKYFYIFLSEAHFNSKSPKKNNQNLWHVPSAHQGTECFRVALPLDAVNQSHFGTATPVNAWPLTHRGVLYTGVVTFVDLFILESRCCRRDDPRECQDRATEGHFLFTSCDMAHVPLSQENEKWSRHCWQFSSRSHFCVLCKVLHCENNQVELV